MKNKISKILGVVLSVALLSSLAVIAAPVAAAPGVNAFGNIDLPSDDFEGTNVTILAFNADGSIMYAAVEDGGDWAVMKSEDGGFNWEDTTMDFAWYTATGSLGRIVDIVVAPSNDGTVYVGYSSGKVYRMLDEGEGTATVLTTIKNEEGINATTLYDIDVFYDDASGANYVLVGTNIDALVFKDAGLFEEWVPLNLIDYAGADNVPGGSDDYLGYGVLAVAFAPDFASSSIIWAVWDNSTTTGDSTSSPMSAPNYLELASTVGTGVWNTVFESLPFDNTTYADEIPASQYPVDIAFPTDYDSEDPYMYLALTDPAAGSGTADGNIYLCVIDDIGGISEAEGLLAANEDMCSVEVYGDVIIGGTLGVGSGDLGIFLSNNGGDTFDFIDGPTGVTYARVYMMPGEFDPAEGVAYCTTMGLGSALSRSVDGGHTWMQIGLIDTDVDWIGDLAFMTEGDTQEAFLITAYGPTRALWRTADATAANVQWERVLSYAPISGNTDYRPLDVEVSMDGSIVMIYADDGGGDYSIYKSTNAGEASPQFTHWRTLPDSDVEDINDWVVYDGSTIYCATDGGFYGTSRFGPATTELTTEDLESVDIQPGFDPDDADAMTIAVGNDDGDIFVSTNKGEDWSAAYATGGGDDVQVAFDADFATAGADGEGLLYFATEDSLVGVAELDGNAVTDIDTLYDSWDMTPGVDSYYELIVAPDNAIYVLGEEETTSTTYTYNVDGTVDLVGEPYIQVNGVIQVMNDSSPSDVSDITYQVDVPLTGVVGTFINGEALLVIGDSLFFDDTADTISGDVIVQGVTSGATGVFNSATALNMQDPALSTWTGGADSTVTVTSSSMFIGIPTATYTYTNVALAGSGWTDG